MSYDHWKTTNPDDAELGNAKQPGENDELEQAYTELERLKAQVKELLEILTTEELLRLRRRCQLQGNERLAEVLFKVLLLAKAL
jgi:hypothetical protein